MSRIRLGIIGAGHLGRIHARLAKAQPLAEVVAVADPLPAARAQVEQELGLPTAADYRELLTRCEAVIVATPTSLHHGVALDFLEHNAHVFVEKPLAPTLAEASELAAAARARGRVLQVGHVERFNPALAAVAPRVTQIKYLDAVRVSGYAFRSTDIGVVLDLMIHDLDLALHLIRSEVVDVQALGLAVLGPHEDMAQARVTFANGCVANFVASRVSYEARRTMQVFGEQAYAFLDFATRQAQVVTPHENVLRRQFDVSQLDAAATAGLKQRFFEDVLRLESITIDERNAIGDEQVDFLSAIAEGREPRVTGQQACQALDLAERILSGIAAHRWTGKAHGPQGPQALPERPAILPVPAASPMPREHRRAG